MYQSIIPRGWLGALDNILVGDYEIGQRGRRYLSLALLVTASLIGMMSFTKDHWYLWTRSVSLSPDFFSGLVALIIVASLYVRALLPVSVTVFGVLSFVLNATITAILVQGLLGQTASFLTRLPMPYLVAFSGLFSWLGMRPLVPWVWGATMIVGMANLLSVSEVMGLWGYAMILTAGLGLALQITGTTGNLRQDLQFHFRGRDIGAEEQRR